jgi:hypothetical protein
MSSRSPRSPSSFWSRARERTDLEESDRHRDRHDDVLVLHRRVVRDLRVHSHDRCADLAVVVMMDLIRFAVMGHLVFVSPDRGVAPDQVHEVPDELVQLGTARDRTVIPHVHQEAHPPGEHAEDDRPTPGTVHADLVHRDGVEREGGECLHRSERVVRVAVRVDERIDARAHVQEERIVRTLVRRIRTRRSDRLLAGGLHLLHRTDVGRFREESILDLRNRRVRVVGLDQAGRITEQEKGKQRRGRVRKGSENSVEKGATRCSELPGTPSIEIRSRARSSGLGRRLRTLSRCFVSTDRPAARRIDWPPGWIFEKSVMSNTCPCTETHALPVLDPMPSFSASCAGVMTRLLGDAGGTN